jgi:flagellin
MAQVVNTNATAMFSSNALSKSKNILTSSMARLSSGTRLNTAADDSAALTSASLYESKYRGASIAQRMANEGLAGAQLRDGYHAQVYENLQRMREIGVQAGGVPAGAEYDMFKLENTRLLGLATVQTAFVISSDAVGTGIFTGAGVAAAPTNTATVAGVDADIVLVNAQRAAYGADMAKFASAANALGVEAANAAAQYSSVADTDFASETSRMATAQIRQQVGGAVQAIANRINQGVTAYLQGL